MASQAQLQTAVRTGRGQWTLGELFRRDEQPPSNTFPYVYADQPLDTALRRMAQSRLNVLPVVSRANVRQLIGTVSFDSVLLAYGLSESKQEPQRPAAQSGGPSRLVAGM